MIDFIQTFMRNIFTQRNNLDYSLTKLMGIFSLGSMIYRFLDVPVPDFQAFGLAVAAVIAALAAKYYVEEEKPVTVSMYDPMGNPITPGMMSPYGAVPPAGGLYPAHPQAPVPTPPTEE